MTHDDAIETLNDLIETCRDGEYAFRSSAEVLKDSHARQVFLRRADECRRAAIDLQAMVVRMGGDAEDAGSANGALHRGWVAVKGTLSGYTDLAIFEETERGEDAALKHYREALDENLPSDALALVQRQMEGAQRNHDQVRALRDAARATHG